MKTVDLKHNSGTGYIYASLYVPILKDSYMVTKRPQRFSMSSRLKYK